MNKEKVVGWLRKKMLKITSVANTIKTPWTTYQLIVNNLKPNHGNSKFCVEGKLYCFWQVFLPTIGLENIEI